MASTSLERGYKFTITETGIELYAGGATATWVLESLISTLNDGSAHYLLVDFRNTGGTSWTLKTSVDGAAFVDRGSASGPVVAAADTAPKIEMTDTEAGAYVDEATMWAGHTLFTTSELDALHDLGNTYGQGMDEFWDRYGWQAAGLPNPDQAVFYNDLDELGDWTGTGVFTAGQVGNGLTGAAGDEFSFGAREDLGDGVFTIVRVSNTMVVVGFVDSGGLAKAVVVSYQGSWTLGPVSLLTATTGAFIPEDGLIMMDAGTTFVIHSAHTPAGERNFFVLTRSGTSLTVGAKRDLGSGPGGIPGGLRYMEKLDSSRFLILYDDGAGTLKARVGTISGTSITFSGEVTVDSGAGTSYDVSVASLGSGRIALAFAHDGDDIPKFKLLTVSGTSLTAGAATVLGSAPAGNVAVRQVDGDRLLFMWEGAGTITARMGSVSGTALTIGPTTSFSGGVFDVAVVDSTKAVVFYHLDVGGGEIRGKGRMLYMSALVVTVGGAVSDYGECLGGEVRIIYMYGDDQEIVVFIGDTQDGYPGGTLIPALVESEASVVSGYGGGYYPWPEEEPTRVVTHGWMQNPTKVSASGPSGGYGSVSFGREYVITYGYSGGAYRITLTHSGGGGGISWSGPAIDTLMATLNDGSPHMVITDFENTGGTTWVLKTSVDGDPWVDHGSETGLAPAVCPFGLCDGDPFVDIFDPGMNCPLIPPGPCQWVDEIVIWVGGRTILTSFSETDLENLNDLGETFGGGMDEWNETFGAPICWQATATLPGGAVWRDSGSGPCPAVIRVPRGAGNVVVTDDGRAVSPRIIEG